MSHYLPIMVEMGPRNHQYLPLAENAIVSENGDTTSWLVVFTGEDSDYPEYLDESGWKNVELLGGVTDEGRVYYQNRADWIVSTRMMDLVLNTKTFPVKDSDYRRSYFEQFVRSLTTQVNGIEHTQAVVLKLPQTDAIRFLHDAGGQAYQLAEGDGLSCEDVSSALYWDLLATDHQFGCLDFPDIQDPRDGRIVIGWARDSRYSTMVVPHFNKSSHTYEDLSHHPLWAFKPTSQALDNRVGSHTLLKSLIRDHDQHEQYTAPNQVPSTPVPEILSEYIGHRAYFPSYK